VSPGNLLEICLIGFVDTMLNGNFHSCGCTATSMARFRPESGHIIRIWISKVHCLQCFDTVGWASGRALDL